MVFPELFLTSNKNKRIKTSGKDTKLASINIVKYIVSYLLCLVFIEIPGRERRRKFWGSFM